MPEKGRKQLSLKDIYSVHAMGEKRIASYLRFLAIAITMEDLKNVECDKCGFAPVIIQQQPGGLVKQIAIDTLTGTFNLRTLDKEGDIVAKRTDGINLAMAFSDNREEDYILGQNRSGLESFMTDHIGARDQIIRFLDQIESPPQV